VPDSKLRRAAPLIVVLFALTTLGAHMHRAFERHGFCSQHGELVHLVGGTPAASAPSAAASLHGSAQLEGPHACANLAVIGQGAQLQAATPAPARTGQISRGALPAAPPERRAILILREAPKSSPPSLRVDA